MGEANWSTCGSCVRGCVGAGRLPILEGLLDRRGETGAWGHVSAIHLSTWGVKRMCLEEGE